MTTNLLRTPITLPAVTPSPPAADVPADDLEYDFSPPPVTIADVAAAAFIAIETLAMILPPKQAGQMLDEFEERAATFSEAFVRGAGTSPEDDA